MQGVGCRFEGVWCKVQGVKWSSLPLGREGSSCVITSAPYSKIAVTPHRVKGVGCMV